MNNHVNNHLDPVIAWLLGEGRELADPNAFLENFARVVRDSGVDVGRITTGVPILHPQLYSFSGLWQLGKGASERLYRIDGDWRSALENSPIRIAYEGGGPVRCRLTEPPRAGEYPIVTDLRAEGFTDYLVLKIPFADGTHKALSVATARSDGFTDAEVALFEALIPALAVNLEMQALRRMARTLLDTYVGRQTGGRVLDGQIRRGMGETIRAVIWLCDLRGFTALSEKLPRDELIGMLNAYFGPMCEAVEANGGEVLKFIGDAMLAIFPVADDVGAACGRALAAAATAQASLRHENALRAENGQPRIDYGIALNVGDVMYGNIGSDTRLDFTVIGPAVNLAARIESLCGKLGRPVLLSAEFVAASGAPVEAVGEFALKGVGEQQRIFAPRP